MKISEFDEGFTGHPGGLTVGRDGNLGDSEQFDDKIAVFDMKGKQGSDGLGKLDLSQGPIDSQQEFDARYKQILGLPKGSGPHDPLFGPDGTLANGADGRTVFFNATIQNAIGMFDLDTNKVFRLKKGISPDGEPLEVVQGPDKSIWFTEVGLITNLPGPIARLEIKR
jgi:streptogramin lyase